MKILIVEDEIKTGEYLSKGLTEAGFVVDHADNGLTGYHLAMTAEYDLVILDIMLPDVNGWDIIRMLRSAGKGMPVLLLTALGTIEHRVKGLELGADDYLVKPFEFGELFARLRALLRRGDAPLQEEVVAVGNWILNRSRRTLCREDVEINLSAREFQLLDLLVQNRGKVLPREVLLDRIWGLGSEVSDNSLDAYVRLLRKKLDRPGEPPLISTVRGIGYKVDS